MGVYYETTGYLLVPSVALAPFRPSGFLIYFRSCFWCFALVFLSYTNAYIYIIFNIRSSRHPHWSRVEQRAESCTLCESFTWSPAGIYTFSGFHLACTFPRFHFASLLLLLNQNKLFVCLFNRVLLFKGLQYWLSYSETLSHCPSLSLWLSISVSLACTLAWKRFIGKRT